MCNARWYCLNPEKFQTQALSLESLQSGWKAETRSSERSDTPRCHHSDQGKGERFRLHRDILAEMPRDSFWERWKLGWALRDGCFCKPQAPTGTPEHFHHSSSFRDCLYLFVAV